MDFKNIVQNGKLGEDNNQIQMRVVNHTRKTSSIMDEICEHRKPPATTLNDHPNDRYASGRVHGMVRIYLGSPDPQHIKSNLGIGLLRDLGFLQMRDCLPRKNPLTPLVPAGVSTSLTPKSIK
ncbi:hypothetical protein CEXT_383761 [Caerostris extrusa]|uniref:Uncharacterized protein n=1 Tax=Caerostris extrusa TaxID=172846 RepID=A0AAV4NZY1_CAEEX|nr:hypothetical protein CEXT_383761 [Caerostris extrusa]